MQPWVISCFCREVAENYALLGYSHYLLQNNPEEQFSDAAFITTIKS
jgi:hypothetical protein